MRQFNFSDPRKQIGMSKWGWLFTTIIVVSLVIGALRLGPHYIDFRIVQGVLDKLPEKEAHEMSRRQIQTHFSKQFRIESFRLPLKEVLNIERNREETIVTIDYEIREHLFYNIDVVLAFRDQRIYN